MSTPEKKPTPREELEMRLTALLMGELPPEEVAALEAQVAADPALAKLQARLRKALELLREASTESEAPASQTPVRLSSERRAKLLAHFQTPRPQPSKPLSAEAIIPSTSTNWKQDRDWTWIIPLGIAATVVALIGIGIGGIVPRRFAIATIVSRNRGDGNRACLIVGLQTVQIDIVPARAVHGRVEYQVRWA